MEEHFKLSDADFEQNFIDCKLKPSNFTHVAHLRVAWININKYGIVKAEKEIQKQLINFAKSVDGLDKYNVTVTIAAIKAVYHFMLKSNSKEFRGFVAEFPRLKNNFKELMGCHYGLDIYNSAEAKSEFIEPDLVPFD